MQPRICMQAMPFAHFLLCMAYLFHVEHLGFFLVIVCVIILKNEF